MNAQLYPAPLLDAIQSAQLDAAADALLLAKQREREATAVRIRAEEAVIALVGVRAEGSQTIATDRFKVKTTGRLNRSIDDAAVLALRPTIPEAMRDELFPARFGLDLATLRTIEKLDPMLYRRVSTALTIKPGKPSVDVEPIA